MDPYKVLGVSTDATDDEIKQAYRRLAKKYHPDANPGDQVAEQRMKEVNAAYDLLMKRHETGNTGSAGSGSGAGSYGGYGGYGPFGGGYGPFTGSSGYEQESPHMRAARQFINNRQYQQALNLLDTIGERTARWHYYCALAHTGLGNRVQAVDHARQAVNMEPNNFEYYSLLNRLQNAGQTYQQQGRQFNMGMGPDKYCLGLCLLNLFCQFCRCC